MFGPFRASAAPRVGLLWKTPWRMSKTRKANVRKRLREVDAVVEALASAGVECRALSRVKELPREEDMSPREKYWVFSRKDGYTGYQKALHKVPHYTKIPLERRFPKGF